jgi:hypothetical protein
MVRFHQKSATVGHAKQIITFDELLDHPDVTAIRDSRKRKAPVPIAGAFVQDCPSDAVVIEDAILLARGGLVWQDYYVPGSEIHYWPTGWRVASWLPGTIIDDSKIEIYEEFLDDLEVVEGIHFHIDTGIAKDNFGHFVHDTLSYLDVYEKCVDHLGELPFASFGLRFPNCLKMFELVFGKALGDAKLDPGKSIMFRKLVLPRRQSIIQENDKFEISFRSLQNSRARLHSTLWDPNSLSSAQFDLFVHRSPSRSFGHRSVVQGRDFENLFEFLNDVAAAGLVCVEPGGLNLPSLAHLFCNARQVVGVHGAGLANILLLPEGRSVVEIRSHVGNWRSIEAVSAVLGHRFFAHDCDAPQGGNQMRLDADKVVALLKSIN